LIKTLLNTFIPTVQRRNVLRPAFIWFHNLIAVFKLNISTDNRNLHKFPLQSAVYQITQGQGVRGVFSEFLISYSHLSGFKMVPG